jgi:hypothetical protein
MRRASRFAVRVLVVAAIVAGVTFVAGLSPRTATPYLSALADLSAVQPAVAQSCEYRGCPKEPGRKSPSCKRSSSAYNCQNIAGGGCQTSPCL